MQQSGPANLPVAFHFSLMAMFFVLFLYFLSSKRVFLVFFPLCISFVSRDSSEGWMVTVSTPGGDDIFRNRPHRRPWDPSRLLHIVYQVPFPDINWSWGGFAIHPHPGTGKAIPLQAWTDPEGPRMLRLPDFKAVSA
jgi:hypothetical protein